MWSHYQLTGSLGLFMFIVSFQQLKTHWKTKLFPKLVGKTATKSFLSYKCLTAFFCCFSGIIRRLYFPYIRGFEGMLPQEYISNLVLSEGKFHAPLLGVLGACSPVKKIWNLELSECNFPAFWEHFKPLIINSTSLERHNSAKKSFLCLNPSQPKFILQFNNILQCKNPSTQGKHLWSNRKSRDLSTTKRK